MTAGNLVQAIRDDREHGASELARQCLDGLVEYARTIQVTDAQVLKAQLIGLARQLQQARPAMAPITNLLAHWLAAFEQSSADTPEDIRNVATKAAEALIQESKGALSKAAANAVNLIGTEKTIITHSLSSTVFAVFEALAPRVRAIVTESRPPGEGRRLAEKLSALGITVEFISDQQMGIFVQNADVALVGADTIASEGSVINKAGTYLLALAARDRGIPFYACFESFKCSKLAPEAIPLEHNDPAEFDPPELPHVEAHNVYFDVTPSELVTAWVTDARVFNERATFAQLTSA
ncbi:MAG: translation initiation factor eIF-2B [Acidiferrobacterales bacterium]